MIYDDDNNNNSNHFSIMIITFIKRQYNHYENNRQPTYAIPAFSQHKIILLKKIIIFGADN